VPFAALHDGRDALIVRYEITCTPSATAWIAQRAPSPVACGAAALVVGCGGPMLPQVDAEVRAIQQALDGKAQVLLNDQATVHAFEAEAPKAQVVHLACHAQARADNPAFSALHLADGVFTLADAAALPWQAGLVVLSACETAISRIAPGDEVQGLSRGFLAAGVPAVVASLWSVSDGSTAELMSLFYRELARGLLPAAALRHAQRVLAQRQPHPFHWAAFSLHGRG
jgi:CHAT domain-containing protein